MATIEPTISIAEFKRRYRPSNPNFVTNGKIKQWIKSGKIRGRSSPEWCVYEDWEIEEMPEIKTTGNALADKALGYGASKT